MNIYDCFMYFDEDLLLDIRLNHLDKFVHKFVITEANYTHNGSRKRLNFDINKFKKFKDKIIYIPLQKQPINLKTIRDGDSQQLKNSKILDNAVIRENFQRNYLHTEIKKFDDNDLKKYLSKISDEALYSYNVYQIEGEGRYLFSNIDGDEDTIMGLPIKRIKEYLSNY